MSSTTEPGKDLTHRTIGGLLWMAGGKGAYGVLQLLVLAVLARLLTPADFGVVSAALVVIGLSQIVSQLGLGPALVQRPTLEPRHIDTAFSVSVILGIGLGALIWLIAPAAAAFFRIEAVAPVLRALAWLFPLQGLGTVAESLMRRDLRFSWLARIDVVTYGVGYGAVGIALALAGWGVWALVAGQIVQSCLKSGALLRARFSFPQHFIERQAFVDLMYFGGGFTLAKIANYVALQGDYFVVGRFLGKAPLGEYSRAYNLMSAPASGLGSILDEVLFPTMARVQSDPVRLAAAFRRGAAFIALCVLPCSIAMIILAPEVVAVLLGSQWTAVIAPLQVLAIGMLFRTSYKLSDSIARATGAVYRRAWRQAVYAALVVTGALIGRRWGITAVAWGVLGALAINFLLMAQLSVTVAHMRWSEFWRAHVPAVATTAATVPVVWLVATLLRHWSAPAAVVLAGAGLLAMITAGGLLFFYAPRFLGPDGMWMVDALRRFWRTTTQRVTRPKALPAL